MNKLNNRGWGLGVMIAMLVVFLLFLLVVAIISYRNGIGGGSV